MFSGSLLAIVLLVAGIIILFKTVRMVPQGYEWTVERFGRYTHTMTPGLHFLIPFVDGVGRKINMMEQVLEVPSQDVITKDNAVVKVDGIVFFQVLDAAKAAYEVAQLEIAIAQPGHDQHPHRRSARWTWTSRCPSATRSTPRCWSPSTRRRIRGASRSTASSSRTSQPPRDLIESMARQMKAEREKRANILEAEGFRQSAILKAEGEKQSAILQPKASAKPRSATPRRASAWPQAEAKATELVSNAIAAGNVQAINYFVAQKYIEAFKALAEGAEPEVRADADGIGRRDRLARRHRRTGQGRAEPADHARRRRDAAARGRLSMRWDVYHLGRGRAAAVRGRDAGAGRVHAVARLRRRGGVRSACCHPRHSGAGQVGGVRRAELRFDPGVSHLVPRPRAAERPARAEPARRALVGRIVPLERGIVQGHGRVQIADAYGMSPGRSCRRARRCGSSVPTA